MLSSSKSPSSTDNVRNKKKRKITSPSIESKSPKIVKLATKENLVRSILEKEEENANEKKLNSSDDSVEIISLDDEKKDLDKSDKEKTKKGDSTPKRSLEKKKKLDKSQPKPGALTKFFKKTDKEVEESDISHENNLSELKGKQDNQDTSVYKEKNEIHLNESSDAQFISCELQDTSQLSETDDHVDDKDVDPLQESDCDITVLSSDNEASSELDKSISSRDKEGTDGPATPVTPKTDKDKKSIKKLTPKQLAKKQETTKRKEERQRLKMVCIVY